MCFEGLFCFAHAACEKETGAVFEAGMKILFRWKRRIKGIENLERNQLNRRPKKVDMEGLSRYEKALDLFLREMAV
jgi:hypothetical protein